jgi:hypothetical protein
MPYCCTGTFNCERQLGMSSASECTSFRHFSCSKLVRARISKRCNGGRKPSISSKRTSYFFQFTRSTCAAVLCVFSACAQFTLLFPLRIISFYLAAHYFFIVAVVTRVCVVCVVCQPSLELNRSMPPRAVLWSQLRRSQLPHGSCRFKRHVQCW